MGYKWPTEKAEETWEQLKGVKTVELLGTNQLSDDTDCYLNFLVKQRFSLRCISLQRFFVVREGSMAKLLNFH